MKHFVIILAVLIAGCSSQQPHVSAHKSPACRIMQDNSGHAYCAVATPAHTGANNSDNGMWLWYMLYLNNQSTTAGPPSIGTGSTWRQMPPGYTPPSLTRTDIAVRVDPKTQEPEQEPENAEQIQDAVVEDPEENPNPEADINEVGPADQAPADESGGDNSSSDDTGGADTGGGSDAGGGGGDGGGG